MIALCHRCGGELPLPPDASRTHSGERMQGGDHGLEPDAILFCPHCSAPQIRFPEHMRELPNRGSRDAHAGPTTGTVPPPQPRDVDWPAALRAAGLVAGGAALLTLLGMLSPLVSLIGTLWVLGCSVLAVLFYSRQRPRSALDLRAGLRIGLVTGVLTVSALGLAMALAGLVARFGLHRMGSFDEQVAQVFAAGRAQMAQRLQESGGDPALQQQYDALLGSPEVRGGFALTYLAVVAALVMLFASAGGAFAGLLRDGRRVARLRE